MASRLTGPYVGTSGFSYASWRPGFYPEGTNERDFLAFYAERLPSVEVNSTFYNLPAEATVERWAEVTPPGFRFALKMNRRISLGGRLELLPSFEQRARLLGDRLGPTRVALDRPRDDGFLGLFLDSIDPELPYALDLRHPTWAGAEDLVRERGVAMIDDLEGPSPCRYVRLREPPYTDEDLAAWADRLRPAIVRGETLYCYLRHEDEPTAPAYAERLLALLRAE
ncbi:MAG TPA: DUF72 domain-containing protein [Gaiellaceae bacterium]